MTTGMILIRLDGGMDHVHAKCPSDDRVRGFMVGHRRVHVREYAIQCEAHDRALRWRRRGALAIAVAAVLNGNAA